MRPFSKIWGLVAAAVVATLAATLVDATANAQDAPTQEALQQQITQRDNLIFNQESLLNTYRCLFDIDTQIVPGGCIDGKPAQGIPRPHEFAGTPTQSEIDSRDQLIADQEALLNVYRCLFNVDTQIVPGGCVDGKPSGEQANESTDDSTTDGSATDETADDEATVVVTPEVLSPWEELVYGEDPGRLIAFADVVRAYSLGTDSWVVWSCDTPEGEWEVPTEETAERLENWAQPYFTWLSGGAYVPRFIVGGTVEADDEQDCLNKVRKTGSPPDMDGAVIVIDIPLVDCNNDVGCRRGWGEPGRCFGLLEQEWVPEQCDPHWPENRREVFLGAVPVTSVPQQIPPTPNGFVLVHEMGHTLLWPHSYDRPDRYFGTNLMDFMGNGQTLNFGTLAINRYAAGWIPIEDVAIHRTPVASDSPQSNVKYELYPLGSPGTQMLVLPTDTMGIYYTLGAREQSGFDADIPVEGVEVYFVDQSDWCEEIPWDRPVVETCFGLGRLQDAYVSPGRSERTASHVLSYGGVLTGNVSHVYQVGEKVIIGDIQVQITGRTADGAGYTVEVGPAT